MAGAHASVTQRAVAGGVCCQITRTSCCSLAGEYGTPNDSVFGGWGVYPTFQRGTHNSEMHAGRRIVDLQRQDFFVEGNGGFPLAVARTYNNWTNNYALNEDGYTSLGPRWHFNYDMHLEFSEGTDGMILRMANGDCNLLHMDVGGIWKSQAAHGFALTLEQLDSGYKLSVSNSHIWYTFDSAGRLSAMRGKSGNVVCFTRDDAGRLLRADLSHETNDCDERFLTFHYEPLTYTDADGIQVTHDRLRRIYYQPRNELAAEYNYDGQGLLYQVKNRFGEVVEEYLNEPAPGNSHVRLISQINAADADGTTHTTRRYEYGANRHVTRVLDGAGSPLVSVTGDTYMVTEHLPEGMTYACQLDFSRNLMQTQWLGPEGRTVRSDRQQFLRDDAWYNSSQLIRLSASDSGETLTREYVSESPSGDNRDRLHVKRLTFADGSHLDYQYDADFNVTSVTRPLNRTTGYGYDSQGNLSSVTDALGQSYYYHYDAWGRLVRCDLPTSVSVSYAYNPHGKLTATTDTLGRVTTYEYDERDRMTARTALGVRLAFSYDDRDRITTVTNPLGNTTGYDYDALDRVRCVTDPMGHVTSYVYNTSGTLASRTDAAGGVTSYGYDAHDRLTSVTDPRGNTTEFSYDALGHLKSRKLPGQQPWLYSYYGMDSLTCPSGSWGKLASVCDAAGRTTTLKYDDMGRLKKVVFEGSPDYVELGYDQAGRLVMLYDSRLSEEWDALNKTFLWQYDALDRVVRETYPNGKSVRWSYAGLGRRLSMTDPQDCVTSYEYSQGRLAAIEHPMGKRTEFRYTSEGLLSEEANVITGTCAQWLYDEVGRVRSINYVNDAQWPTFLYGTRYEYNACDMPVVAESSSDYPDQFPAFRELLDYDGLGRLTEETRYSSSEEHPFFYESYRYDTAGNRVSRVHGDGVTSYTMLYSHNASNQMEWADNGDRAWIYEYDANGNLIMRDGSNMNLYFHDRCGRMNRIWDPNTGMSVAYEYDAFGRVILRTDLETGMKSRYYYDGFRELVVEEKPEGCSEWRKKFINTLKPSPKTYMMDLHEYTYESCRKMDNKLDAFCLYDLQGNVVAAAERHGRLVQSQEFDGFGALLHGDGYWCLSDGMMYDQEAGIYRAEGGRRWYEPTLGRWIEPERAGAVGANAYEYRPQAPLTPAWGGAAQSDFVFEEGAAWPAKALEAQFGTLAVSPAGEEAGAPAQYEPANPSPAWPLAAPGRFDGVVPGPAVPRAPLAR